MGQDELKCCAAVGSLILGAYFSVSQAAAFGDNEKLEECLKADPACANKPDEGVSSFPGFAFVEQARYLLSITIVSTVLPTELVRRLCRAIIRCNGQRLTIEWRLHLSCWREARTLTWQIPRCASSVNYFRALCLQGYELTAGVYAGPNSAALGSRARGAAYGGAVAALWLSSGQAGAIRWMHTAVWIRRDLVVCIRRRYMAALTIAACCLCISWL